jgi:cell division protein FtsX
MGEQPEQSLGTSGEGQRRTARVLWLIAGAIVAIAAMGAFAFWVITDDADDGDANVASREVPLDEMQSPEVTVSVLPGDSMPTVDQVRDRLQRSSVVAAFAEMPRGYLSWPDLAAATAGGDDPPFAELEPIDCETFLAPAFVVDLDFGASATPALDLAGAVAPAIVRSLSGRDLATVVEVRDETELFMDPDATPAQVAAVADALDSDPEVVSFRHLTKQDALAEFLRMFKDDPDLTSGVTAEALPESFRLELAEGIDPRDIAARYEDASAVQSVITPAIVDGPDPVAPDETHFYDPRDDPVDAEIFMQLRANESQVASLSDALEADPDVADVQFLTHEDAYDEFTEVFADEPALIEHVRPETLPESFRLVLSDDADPEGVVDRYEDFPGVEQGLAPDLPCEE